ncbi:MAG: LysM peptidoglycan-binding domain-containing protein [Bacteroidota bacterium]
MSSRCPPGSFPYVIGPGDTLFRLAQTYGTTVNAILSLNPGLDPNNLQIGQTVCIPGPSPVVCPPGSFPYLIQPGDTLFLLAQRFGTTVPAIVALNPGIDPNNLRIGQTVCLPEPVTCPGGTIYTVRPGDTYFLIATRFDVSFEALLAYNPGLDPYLLSVGQRLCIPPAQALPCPADNTYVIGPGENLTLVGERFTVSATDILILNPRLRPSDFTPGRTICIPTRPAPG